MQTGKTSKRTYWACTETSARREKYAETLSQQLEDQSLK